MRPDLTLVARDLESPSREVAARPEPIGLRAGRPGSMTALVAVLVTITLELLRAYPALAAWHPGTRDLGSVPWSTLYLAPFAGAAVLLVLLVAGDTRRLLVATAAAVAFGRGGAQLVESDLRLVLAAGALAGALALVALLATLGLPMFGTGVLAGVAVDLALQVALGTRSLIWFDTPAALLGVAVMGAWLVALAIHRSRREVFVLGRSLRSSLPLTVIGVVLVVEAHHLGALGWVAHVLSSGWLAAAVVVLAGAASGMAASVLTARHPGGPWSTVAGVGGLAIAAAVLADDAPGWWWAPVLVVAHIGVAVTLTLLVARGVGTGRRRGPVVALLGGMALVAAGLTIGDGRGVAGLAIPPPTILVALGAMAALTAVLGWCEVRPAAHRPGLVELASLLGVLAVPAAALVLSGWLAGGARVAAASGDGVRVVTYNVALAFGADGRPNVAEVAATLAELEPDVVSLQEVPRGQWLAGGVDMVGWLQRELEMPYAAFQPAVPGALHGNAVVSRHPILGVEEVRFDREGTALARGAISVLVDVPGREPIRVVGAHLPPDGTVARRLGRVDALVELWAGRPRTVIAADLNTSPHSAAARRLAASGLVSAWDPADGPGHTYPAHRPAARIDWILHSDDLEAVETAVHPSTASDHLPVLAVLR